MVRAKFTCVNKKDNQVAFLPVCSGSEENKEFWRYTPAGQIFLHIDNEAAMEQFEVGKEYYVDFKHAD